MLAISLAGCGGPGFDTGDGDYMDGPVHEDCTEQGTCPPAPGDGSVPVGSPCSDAAECGAGGACVAPWSEGEVGDFTCSAQCVANDDESSWCLGSASCCDPEATCNARGLCRVGAQAEGGDSAEDEGAASDDASPPSEADTGEAPSDDDGADAGESSTGLPPA